ncbi:hypothetical protein [Streptomyces sp. NPDC050704]|uniref:hypothetical protein n=1 Tax=Streptomyces sp. NPDC050704 TaxID=3157219 RepID=UPI003424A6D0
MDRPLGRNRNLVGHGRGTFAPVTGRCPHPEERADPARRHLKDGETKKVDQEIGGDCAELGLVKENLLIEPHPRPGEFVRGTTVLMVPDTQRGVLEFADGMDHAMFKVETSRR